MSSTPAPNEADIPEPTQDDLSADIGKWYSFLYDGPDPLGPDKIREAKLIRLLAAERRALEAAEADAKQWMHAASDGLAIVRRVSGELGAATTRIAELERDRDEWRQAANDGLSIIRERAVEQKAATARAEQAESALLSTRAEVVEECATVLRRFIIEKLGEEYDRQIAGCYFNDGIIAIRRLASAPATTQQQRPT